MDRRLGFVVLALLLGTGCGWLMRGNEAACLEACRREGGQAQGSSPCEQGCRRKTKSQEAEWKTGGDKATGRDGVGSSGSLGIFW